MNPVAVSTWGDSRKHFKAFMESARRHGIEPQNADPEIWPGKDWREIPWWRKSDAQSRFVHKYADKYSHYLFCDSYDIIWAAGWDEIISKFNKLQSPIVFGTERYCWPDPAKASLYPACPYPTRFLNAGFWLATAEYALKLAGLLALKARQKNQCDSGICVDLFLSRQLPIRLDTSCSLLYCCNLDSMEHVAFESGRVKALETGESPCLFHGNGNADMSKLYDWLKL